jgi:hypothetical protein
MAEESMTKAEVLQAILRGRVEWEAAVAAVPAHLREAPGTDDTWGYKDILAHVMSYERWMADQLEMVVQGSREMAASPWAPPEEPGITMDQRNALILVFWRDAPLDEIEDAENAAYQRVLMALEVLPEAAFSANDYAWANGFPLWYGVKGNTFEHYQEHIPMLRALAASEVA